MTNQYFEYNFNKEFPEAYKVVFSNERLSTTQESINTDDSIYFNTTYNKVLQCFTEGNHCKWLLNISGTATEDGTLVFTFTEDNNTEHSITIQVKKGETDLNIRKKIAVNPLYGCFYLPSQNVFLRTLPGVFTKGSGAVKITQTDATGITSSLSYIQYGSSSIWKDLNGFTPAKSVGDTRPILTADDKGFQFFDETLGKPIYWNGSAWVDATGTPV